MPAYCGLGLDYSLEGDKVGSLTRLGPSFRTVMGHGKVRVVVCRCDCGITKVLEDGALKFRKGGACKSCGARKSRTVHGLTKSAEYKVWSQMNKRCHKPSHVSYRFYGARGIRVADEWRGRGGFQRFFEHVGNRPSPLHQIDRIISSGNYEAGNVRWVTPKQNQRNKRSNRLLTINGETRCLAEWSEISGVNAATIASRLKTGVPMTELLRPCT